MFGRRDNKSDPDRTDPRARPEGREPGAEEDTGQSDLDAARTAEYERVLADLANVTLERDQAKSDYLRALAEYQNYQRRALQNEQEAKRQGVTSVLSSILPVVDHFDMALTQKPDSEATQRVIDGVRVIKSELIRALERHGVGLIQPAPGDEPDPTRHSVLMHKPAEGVAPGTISGVMQAGYTLDGRVVRPAMVTVAPMEPAGGYSESMPPAE